MDLLERKVLYFDEESLGAKVSVAKIPEELDILQAAQIKANPPSAILMLRDYENNQRRHNEARAARGLGPKQPSVIELQKAKAAFKARRGANPVSAKVLRERKKAARKRREAQEDA